MKTPPHHHQTYRTEIEKPDCSSRSSQWDSEPVLFVTGSSQVRHGDEGFVTKGLKAGDKVKYVGGMIKYQGKKGVVVKVCDDRYKCQWAKEEKLTEAIPVSELEVEF